MFSWLRRSKGPRFPSTDRVYATRQAKLAALRAACTDRSLVIGPFENELEALAAQLGSARPLVRVGSREALRTFSDQAAAGSTALALVHGDVIVSEATMATVHVTAALAILVVERHPLRSRDDTVLSWAAECPPGTSVT
jgi:hypothetical protein